MLNKIILAGRLVREPEYRTTGNGTSVCNFTLAVDRDFKSQSGEKETDFIDCVAWKQQAEFVTTYIRKGMLAAVAGRLLIESWTDKDGNRRRSAKVHCDNVYSLEKSRDGTQEQRGQQSGNSGYAAPAAYPQAVYDQGEYPELTDHDGNLPF